MIFWDCKYFQFSSHRRQIMVKYLTLIIIKLAVMSRISHKTKTHVQCGAWRHIPLCKIFSNQCLSCNRQHSERYSFGELGRNHDGLVKLVLTKNSTRLQKLWTNAIMWYLFIPVNFRLRWLFTFYIGTIFYQLRNICVAQVGLSQQLMVDCTVAAHCHLTLVFFSWEMMVLM